MLFTFRVQWRIKIALCSDEFFYYLGFIWILLYFMMADEVL